MKKTTPPLLFLFAVLFGVCFSLTSRAGEVITNEKLHEMIGTRSHTVMAKQLERLQEVLEAFLKGDWQQIYNTFYRIRQDIDQIGNQYAQYSSQKIEMLKSLDAMRAEVTAVQTELEAKNYEKTYEHYQKITYQCIQCHQTQRSWGKFEKVKEKEENPENAAPAGKQATSNVSFE